MRHFAAGRIACVVFVVLSVLVLTGCQALSHAVCILFKNGQYNWELNGCELFPEDKSSAASAGDALFVSAAAHVAGAAGTNWRTDLQIHNLADSSADVRVSLLVHGADNSVPEYVDLTLDSGESLRLGDVLARDFDVDSGQAALLIEPSSGRVIVTSRTYNLLGAGNQLGLPAGSTFGQFIPALSMSSAIRFGEQGRLIQLAHNRSSDSGFRANLGLVNATTRECRVEAELYRADGELLGTVPVDLPALGYRQLNRVFAGVTTGDVDDGYAVVRTTTPGTAFYAYASVVDNLTGDPVAVSAVRLLEQVPEGVADPIYVAASAHVAGAAGTNWRTDLEVHNHGDDTASYGIELLEHGIDNSDPRSRPFVLGAGESTRFEDVLDTVFSFEGAAALRITPSSGRVIVTSRTYNLLGEGNDLGLPAGATFGQYIPGLSVNEAIQVGEESRLIQLSHSRDDASGFRTNLVLVNATGGRIDVEIGLFRADGTHLGTVDRSLAPYEYRQLNRMFALVTAGDVDDGYALVRTTTEGGSLFALASVVDNSTGDPVGMSGPAILPEGVAAALDDVEGMMAVLGQTDLESVADNIQSMGVDGLFDALVAAQGDTGSRTATGMAADYGDGWVAPDGSIFEGVVNVDGSALSVDAGGIAGSVIITHDGLMVDGEPALIGPSEWEFDVVKRSDGSVVGEINVRSPGGLKNSGSIFGTIGIDTAICLNYPISGSLTVVIKGEQVIITFSPDCDGGVSHETSASSSETFSYGFGSPESANALDYVTATSNAVVAQEEEGRYWRPMVGAQTLAATNPGVVTFHFPFDSSIVGGRLLVVLTTFQWSYSQGHSYLYGSTDGINWQLLSEIEPPAHGDFNPGGWNGDLPDIFIGASDIWLEARMYSYGPRAEEGDVWCNTAQLCRWHPSQTSNTFELEVVLE